VTDHRGWYVRQTDIPEGWVWTRVSNRADLFNYDPSDIANCRFTQIVHDWLKETGFNIRYVGFGHYGYVYFEDPVEMKLFELAFNL
jgi:hypothetical protein